MRTSPLALRLGDQAMSGAPFVNEITVRMKFAVFVGSRYACPGGLGCLGGPGQAPIHEALALELRTDGIFF